MTELEFMEKVLHELDTLKGLGIGIVIVGLSILLSILGVVFVINDKK